MAEYRIRIRGGSGSGKSTLATYLGKYLGIDTVIHLDDIFWQPGWQMIEFSELNERVLKQVRTENNWVVDGNYRRMGDDLTKLSTHVIIIRPPLYRNLWRLLVRELVRRTRFKFIQVTPVPMNVREDPNDGILEIITMLGVPAVDYYTTKSRETYQKLKRDYPEIKVFVYDTSKSGMIKLLAFLQSE